MSIFKLRDFQEKGVAAYSRTQKFPNGLYAICDDSAVPEREFLSLVDGCLEGGVRLLQLRMKKASLSEALRLAEAAVARCHQAGAWCLINDRVDLALLSGADGVHVGEDDLPVAAARRLLGENALIGATVRTLESAQRAQREGASYVGVGPVFPTRTKSVAHPPLGLEALAVIVAGCSLPVVAISGIGPTNIGAVAATGVAGAAVVSQLLGAENIAAQARMLQARFEEGSKRA